MTKRGLLAAPFLEGQLKERLPGAREGDRRRSRALQTDQGSIPLEELLGALWHTQAGTRRRWLRRSVGALEGVRSRLLKRRRRSPR